LYGVGRASVGYILTDVFHGFDELTHISPWEQWIYSRLLFSTPVEEPAPVSTLLHRMASWSPWRALAVHYLWEDLFWRHKTEGVDWLGPLIRLEQARMPGRRSPGAFRRYGPICPTSTKPGSRR
jgi:hypothetical protein